MAKVQKRVEKPKAQPKPKTLKGRKQISEFLGGPVSVVKTRGKGRNALTSRGPIRLLFFR